ncbi:hypothetical protein M427DRAFT_33286 [Gonapodya prolifera JEL478]|uniref:Uncharacterized protein n=1 Tax=Gonapodya prolifera (strain JEL478) TaxID=1344416 RepID=A0A139ABT4_GONPJ|nr:hypothetical protein M427DRAFT_33286 [Gonapodya prolifera JEL478]|eukprot:KXS14064.1 hypothetical protein M427DRAFT_33286 [Gonapodya prolifera JEL478]
MGCTASKIDPAEPSNKVSPEPLSHLAKERAVKELARKAIAFEIPLDEEFKVASTAEEASPKLPPRGALPSLSLSKEDVTRKIKEAEALQDSRKPRNPTLPPLSSSSNSHTASRALRPPTSKRRPAPFQGLDLYDDGESPHREQSPQEIARKLKEKEEQAERRRREREEEFQKRLEAQNQHARQVKARKNRLANTGGMNGSYNSVQGRPSDMTIAEADFDGQDGYVREDLEIESEMADGRRSSKRSGKSSGTRKTSKSERSSGGSKPSLKTAKKSSSSSRNRRASDASYDSRGSTRTVSADEEDVEVGGKTVRYAGGLDARVSVSARRNR